MYAAFAVLVLLRFSASIAAIGEREHSATYEVRLCRICARAAVIMFTVTVVVCLLRFTDFWYEPLVTLTMIGASSFLGAFVARIAPHQSWLILCIGSFVTAMIACTFVIVNFVHA